MSIGDGRRTYSDSTLKSMTKDELIDIIRCLENNLRNAHETNDIQYENCKRLLSEEKNKTLDKVLKACDIECGLYSGDVKKSDKTRFDESVGWIERINICKQ